MLTRALKWSLANNSRIWQWFKRRRGFFGTIVGLFGIYWAYSFNLMFLAVVAFLIGPVGFTFMAINYVLGGIRGWSRRQLRSARVFGTLFYGPIWLASSALYAVSKTTETILTLGEYLVPEDRQLAA